MRSLAIVGLCVGAAVCYGIVHDQITARICVEYFTIGHPPVFETESPTLLGIGWGIIATWWVGLSLGVPLAIVARVGSLPKFSARDLAPAVGRLLVVMAVLATLSGLIGYGLAKAGSIWLDEWLADRIPADRHARFLADLWTHLASYAGGFLGGLVVIAATWRRRLRLVRRQSSRPESPTGVAGASGHTP